MAYKLGCISVNTVLLKTVKRDKSADTLPRFIFHDVLHRLDFIFKTVLESVLEKLGENVFFESLVKYVNMVPLWKSGWRLLHHYSHATGVLFSETLSGYTTQQHLIHDTTKIPMHVHVYSNTIHCREAMELT